MKKRLRRKLGRGEFRNPMTYTKRELEANAQMGDMFRNIFQKYPQVLDAIIEAGKLTGEDLLDQATKGTWMEGKRPCGECSFVISNEEAARNDGKCDNCKASEYTQEYPHFHYNYESYLVALRATGGDYSYDDYVRDNMDRAQDFLNELLEEENPDEETQAMIALLTQAVDPDA